MFNLKRAFGFWGRLLRLLLPILIISSFLTFLAVQATGRFWTGWRLLLALVAGWIVATLSIAAGFALTTAYMRALYDLKGLRESFWFLVHCLIGQAGFRPWLMVEGGRLCTDFSDPDSLIAKMGGPGNLVIRKDTAVLLEQGGRLNRVEGPGSVRLRRFERIYDTIDLRPRRWQLPVAGMSKEGIPVTCDTDIEFQIQDDGQQATGDRPFPMDPTAVFIAATSKWIREAYRPEEDQVLDWKGLIVISATEGTLRFILARYPLDRLIAPDGAGAEHPRRAIKQELTEALNKAAANVGAKILKVELGEIKVDDEVTQQWIETWRANWDRWGTEYLAEAEAFYVETVGATQSEVVARQISDMANVLHELGRQGPQALMSGVRMQLHLMLRNLGTDSLALTYLPAEATKLLTGQTDQSEAKKAQGA
jgi:regulator of protease activity HflC (stomatin/prohibitin superfamily)